MSAFEAALREEIARQQGGTLSWSLRPWYRTKVTVAFPDLLTTLRQELWRAQSSAAPAPAQRPQNPPPVRHHTQQLAA